MWYAFLTISSKLLESIDLRTEAKPYLQLLENETNEVIHLVVFDQGEVVYIEKLEGNELLRMHSRVGKRAPMHCTSVGKAILANLSRTEAIDILERKGMPRHTDDTITDLDEFLKELDAVREQGYALDLEENEHGITCIAAPIFDHSGNVYASVSISGTTERMTKERLNLLKTRIIDIGGLISSKLGYKE